MTAPLTDADFARLDELLDSDIFSEDAMSLDALQGFLCAVVSAPEDIPDEDLLFVGLGGKPKYDSAEQEAEVRDLVLRFKAETAAALSGGEGLDLQLYQSEEGGDYNDSYARWAAGYLEGVELSPWNWFEAGDEDEVSELLLPFGVLADEEEYSGSARETLDSTEYAALVDECREDLVSFVVQAYRYWQVVRNTKTVKRGQPKVGRNDPCPCGSGRKFKACCGKQ